jgi:hypothetical protein
VVFSRNRAIKRTVTVTGGTLSPGNSPGSLDVNGAITFGAASQFLVEVGGRLRAMASVSIAN